MNLIVILALGVVLASVDGRQETSDPPVPSSANNLGEKPVISLDPKLRRALLRVLNKLEKEEKEQLDLAAREGGEIDEGEILQALGARREGRRQEDVSTETQELNFVPPPTEAAQQEEKINNPEKYPPTNPTPQQETRFFQFPSPIEAPDHGSDEEVSSEEDEDQRSEEDDSILRSEEESQETGKTIVDSASSISQEVKPEKKKNTTEKHTVEFLPSSLIAAFTVQQDDRGIPRKVIPLDYRPTTQAPEGGSPVAADRQKEIAEKEARIQQELRLLRQQQEAQERELIRLRENTRPEQFDSEFYSPLAPENFLQQEARKKQQEILLGQQYELQRQREIQRQQELLRRQELQRQEELERQREYQRQQEFYRRQELQRLQYLERQRYQRQQEDQRSKQVEFQRSVDYNIDQRPPFQPFSNFQTQFVPGIELNRVNRQEGGNYIRNPGFVPRPERQLENLLVQSGVQFQGNGGEDLNIVSKVLALNHGASPQRYFPRDLQVLPSSNRGHYITPAPLIQPPNL